MESSRKFHGLVLQERGLTAIGLLLFLFFGGFLNRNFHLIHRICLGAAGLQTCQTCYGYRMRILSYGHGGKGPAILDHV